MKRYIRATELVALPLGRLPSAFSSTKFDVSYQRLSIWCNKATCLDKQTDLSFEVIRPPIRCSDQKSFDCRLPGGIQAAVDVPAIESCCGINSIT